MMAYSAYAGWTSGDHTELDPQPSSPGLLAAEVIVAASGKAVDDGFYMTEWRFNSATRDDFNAVNTALGLTTARSAKVTVMTRRQEDDDDDDDFIEARAWVTKPNPNYNLGFHQDLIYRLTHIRIVTS